MKIPSLLSRRSEPATTYDSNGDGRVDGFAEAVATDTSRPVGQPVLTDRGDEQATYRLDRDRTAERPSPADRTAERPVPAARTAADAETRSELTPQPELKPRASLLATLGLIVGVAGALAVLTGTLAGYGIAVGALGAVLSVFGLLATRRRHIAGKTDALFGMAFGLAAVVLGVLAMTGQFDWPTTDGDWVQRLREWLDSQVVDRF